jgi:hypothetical protein
VKPNILLENSVARLSQYSIPKWPSKMHSNEDYFGMKIYHLATLLEKLKLQRGSRGLRKKYLDLPRVDLCHIGAQNLFTRIK